MSQVCRAIIICSDNVVEQTINLSCKQTISATFGSFSVTVFPSDPLESPMFTWHHNQFWTPLLLRVSFSKEIFENYWFTTPEKRLEMCGDFQILYNLNLEMNYKCIQRSRTYAYPTWTKRWVINFVLIYEYLWEQMMTIVDLVWKEKYFFVHL